MAGKFPDRVSRRSPIRPRNSRLNNGGARLRPFGLRLTRRRLLATSGATVAAGTSVAFAACGDTEEETEDVTPARQAELLNAILAQQLAVEEACEVALGNAPDELQGLISSLRDERRKSIDDLDSTITDLDGTPITDGVGLAGGESPTEGLARQLETSIAATLQAIGELPPESRQPIQQAITDDAAVLAGIRSVLGEEVAPDAFVMGPPSQEDS
jgi:hypothetical protein